MARLQTIVLSIDFPAVGYVHVVGIIAQHHHPASNTPAAAQVDGLGRIGVVHVPEGIVVVELQQQLLLGIAGVAVGAGFYLGRGTAACEGKEAEAQGGEE